MYVSSDTRLDPNRPKLAHALDNFKCSILSVESLSLTSTTPYNIQLITTDAYRKNRASFTSMTFILRLRVGLAVGLGVATKADAICKSTVSSAWEFDKHG